MAEEQVSLSSPGASLALIDLKLKLEELEELEPETQPKLVADPTGADSEEKPEEHEQENNEEAGADFLKAKRPRIDEKADDLAGENGFKLDNNEILLKEDVVELNVVNESREEMEPTAKNHETADSQKVPCDGSEENNLESLKGETEKLPENIPEQEVDDSAPQAQAQPISDDGQTTSRKMEVPNYKVGVLIGKAWDTIRFLQSNSRAKIQITKDAEVDPNLTTRPLELIGTLSNIEKAEKLINVVIAKANAGVPLPL